MVRRWGPKESVLGGLRKGFAEPPEEPEGTWHTWAQIPGDQVVYLGVGSPPPWKEEGTWYLTPEEHEKILGSDRTYIEEAG